MTEPRWISSLRQDVVRLLESGEIVLAIGYEQAPLPGKARPLFVRRPADAARLIFDRRCAHNLTVYLTRRELPKTGKIAVMVKGCDLRSLTSLIQESQVDPARVLTLGVACDGVGPDGKGTADKCVHCTVRAAADANRVFGQPAPATPTAAEDAEVARLLAMSPAERLAYWNERLSACIKCYAYRAACPMCYCQRCFVERTRPAWVDPSSHPRGNLAYHMFRAFHLAGRCISCGECERACPVDIPLMTFNRRLAQVIKDRFIYEAGNDAEAAPPLTAFAMDDPQEFIG